MGVGEEMIPILLKNMMTIILVWGLGFVVGSYSTYRGVMEEVAEEVAVDLEDWR